MINEHCLSAHDEFTGLSNSPGTMRADNCNIDLVSADVAASNPSG
jgi:hypothetical protein